MFVVDSGVDFTSYVLMRDQLLKHPPVLVDVVNGQGVTMSDVEKACANTTDRNITPIMLFLHRDEDDKKDEERVMKAQMFFEKQVMAFTDHLIMNAQSGVAAEIYNEIWDERYERLFRT